MILLGVTRAEGLVTVLMAALVSGCAKMSPAAVAVTGAGVMTVAARAVAVSLAGGLVTPVGSAVTPGPEGRVVSSGVVAVLIAVSGCGSVVGAGSTAAMPADEAPM
jgi:uncharacterized protein YceK